MVLLGRIELPTSPLPRVRSTTELQQPAIRRLPPPGPARDGAMRHGCSRRAPLRAAPGLSSARRRGTLAR